MDKQLAAKKAYELWGDGGHVEEVTSKKTGKVKCVVGCRDTSFLGIPIFNVRGVGNTWTEAFRNVNGPRRKL